MFSKNCVVYLVVMFFTIAVLCENKYSKDANTKKNKGVDFRTLEKPFRMNKLNLIWIKAQQRLTEPKLKSLYSDLMIQDKEEITFKRFKNDGGDKDGMKEAELRRKLTNIMSVYGLREHFGESAVPNKEHSAFNSVIDDHINKSLFKDKKLNMLWAKAETSGFTSEELAALKEEFNHHQDKIDQYYDLLKDVESGPKDGFQNIVDEEESDIYNEINDQLETNEINKDFIHKANLVRDKHKGLRDGYDRLHRITAKGPNNKEFIEPKVQELWRVAAASNFTVEELASIKASANEGLSEIEYLHTIWHNVMMDFCPRGVKFPHVQGLEPVSTIQVELQHYERRLLKLRHLQADQVSKLDKRHTKIAAAGDKLDHFDHEQQMIKTHTRKVEKMQADLENRILGKHSEL